MKRAAARKSFELRDHQGAAFFLQNGIGGLCPHEWLRVGIVAQNLTLVDGDVQGDHLPAMLSAKQESQMRQYLNYDYGLSRAQDNTSRWRFVIYQKDDVGPRLVSEQSFATQAQAEASCKKEIERGVSLLSHAKGS